MPVFSEKNTEASQFTSSHFCIEAIAGTYNVNVLGAELADS
jgi:hypothetical protein